MFIIKNKFMRMAFPFTGFLAGPAVSALLSFIVVPVTTWMVLPEEFGRISMYTVVLSLGGLVSYAGLDQAFVREYSCSPDKILLFRRCLAIPLALISLFSLVLMLCFPFFSSLLWGESTLLGSSLLCLGLLFSVFDRFSGLVVRMQERAWTYSAILVFRQASCLGFTLLFLKLFSRDYLTLISASVLSIALSSVAGIYFSRSYWFSPWRDVFDKVAMRPLIRFGLPLVPASIMMWILNGMDKIALRHWGTFQDLGIYSAGFKVVGVLNIVNMAFSTFWAPVSYRWFESGVSAHRFDKVAKYLALSLTVLAIFLALSKDYIVFLLDPSYRAASELIPFLMFVPIMYLLSEVTGIGIGFARRSEFHLLASGAAAFFNLIGNWILVPLYGAVGASIATAISYVIFMILKSVVGSLLWRKNFGQPFVYLMVIIMVGSSFLHWLIC